MQSTSTLNTDSATKSSVFDQYKASLENKSPRQSGYLLFLAMMYLTIMLCSGVLTHRLIQLGHVYTMAGTLVAPLWFTLSDVIAEIYGYKVARKLVWFGFVCQAIFAIVCNLLIQIPSPDFLDNQAAFFTVFAVFLIQVGKLPLSQMLTIMAVSYSLKVVYTIVLAFPANILTFAIKKADGIDVYDHHTNFNPFKL